MTQKTQIQRGSRVLVKTRDAYGHTKVREGFVIDAQRDCLKIQFRLWLFRWSEWLPIKDDRRAVEFISANADLSSGGELK